MTAFTASTLSRADQIARAHGACLACPDCTACEECRAAATEPCPPHCTAAAVLDPNRDPSTYCGITPAVIVLMALAGHAPCRTCFTTDPEAFEAIAQDDDPRLCDDCNGAEWDALMDGTHPLILALA